MEGVGVVIKAENDWSGVWRPQVAMHRNCHFFQFSVQSHSRSSSLVPIESS